MSTMRLVLGLVLALFEVMAGCEDDSKYGTGGPTASTAAGGANGGGGSGGTSDANGAPDASQD